MRSEVGDPLKMHVRSTRMISFSHSDRKNATYTKVAQQISHFHKVAIILSLLQSRCLKPAPAAVQVVVKESYANFRTIKEAKMAAVKSQCCVVRMCMTLHVPLL